MDQVTNGSTAGQANGATAHDSTVDDDDPPRAKWNVQAPGWLPSYGLPPTPGDFPDDNNLDGGARALLLHLAEARACMERFYGFWTDRDQSFPGDAEIAALVARHAYACHNVTTHLEMLRDYWEELPQKAEATKTAAPAKTEAAKTEPVPAEGAPAPAMELADIHEELIDVSEDLDTLEQAMLAIAEHADGAQPGTVARLCERVKRAAHHVHALRIGGAS